ncbi:hypothetical protein C8R43DRAFT_1143645 [Mycena crocata]|nr:hypothetical protein C8R43DRAFT_1143645 [Mycena crocata]
MRLLQDALHRSAQTPLSIILELDGEFDEQTDHRPALHLLLQHSRRRRTASLTCDFRQLPLISPPSGNLGMLHTLDITCDDEEAGTLGLEGAIFYPLPGLRQLTFSDTSTQPAACGNTEAGLMSIMSRLPSAAAVRIIWLPSEDEPPTPPPTSSDVTYIRIALAQGFQRASASEALERLSALTLPQLKRLDIVLVDELELSLR